MGLEEAGPEVERLVLRFGIEEPCEVGRVVHIADALRRRLDADAVPGPAHGIGAFAGGFFHARPPAFAGVAGMVAGRCQAFRQRGELRRQPSLDEGALLQFPEVPAGEQRRPRWCARRCRAVTAREQHPGLRHPVKGRRLHGAVSVGAALQPTLVVIDDDEDVGALGFRGLRDSQRREQQGGEEREGVFHGVSLVCFAEVLSSGWLQGGVPLVPRGLEAFHDVGVLRGEVVALAGVSAEIEKLRGGCFALHELPAALASSKPCSWGDATPPAPAAAERVMVGFMFSVLISGAIPLSPLSRAWRPGMGRCGSRRWRGCWGRVSATQRGPCTRRG